MFAWMSDWPRKNESSVGQRFWFNKSAPTNKHWLREPSQQMGSKFSALVPLSSSSLDSSWAEEITDSSIKHPLLRPNQHLLTNRLRWIVDDHEMRMHARFNYVEATSSICTIIQHDLRKIPGGFYVTDDQGKATKEQVLLRSHIDELCAKLLRLYRSMKIRGWKRGSWSGQQPNYLNDIRILIGQARGRSHLATRAASDVT